MTSHATCLVALTLALGTPLQAADELDLRQSKPQTAQAITLARLGAVLCPEMDVDEQAVHVLMESVGITDKDIFDPAKYGGNDTTVARSFARSFMADPGDTCGKLYVAFGPGKGQLLHHGEKQI